MQKQLLFGALVLALGACARAKPAMTGGPASSTPSASAASAQPAGAAPGNSPGPEEMAPPDTHAVRGLDMGTKSPPTVEPMMTAIPSPPATLDVPPHAGVETTLKSIPNGIPMGHLSHDQLELPLRDPKRFERCEKPHTTHADIEVIVYNGAAQGVDVRTTPPDRALNFCMEHVVREITWVKELAVNRVKVSL